MSATQPVVRLVHSCTCYLMHGFVGQRGDGLAWALLGKEGFCEHQYGTKIAMIVAGLTGYTADLLYMPSAGIKSQWGCEENIHY